MGGNLRTRHPHDYPDAAYTDPYLIRRPFTFLKASEFPALRKSCPGRKIRSCSCGRRGKRAGDVCGVAPYPRPGMFSKVSCVSVDPLPGCSPEQGGRRFRPRPPGHGCAERAARVLSEVPAERASRPAFRAAGGAYSAVRPTAGSPSAHPPLRTLTKGVQPAVVRRGPVI